MKTMDMITPLLPSPTAFQLESLHFDGADHHIDIQLASAQPAALCPGCGQSSTRVHSYYKRTVADLPWADWAVRLDMTMRKFRCANAECQQQVFCERLPSVVAPWARKTLRLASQQRHIGLALGGVAGARLSQHVDRPTSRNTMLRLIRSTPSKTHPTPRVLGVDDWAKRKGQSYATVLIDLERGCVIELLPDRRAQTLADWLQAHPGVEIICRDRAEAYASGASSGAPEAVQVADRFHLLRNLADTLQQVFEEHRSQLMVGEPEALPQSLHDPKVQGDTASSSSMVVHCIEPALTEKGQRRLEHYKQARTLHEQEWTFSAIGRHLGISRHSVRRYVRSESFPDRRRVSILDPYKSYLIKRWNGGCHTGTVLYEEIQQRGYRGKRSNVLAYITRLRKGQGLPPRSRMLTPGDAVKDDAAHRLTPRQATWLVLGRQEKQDQEAQQQIRRLSAADAALEEAIELAQSFAHLVRERLGAHLDEWLARAETSTLAAFGRFAKSLRGDYAAVKAGLTLSWSSGPVEGHVNRLKMLKRQMYGRAKLDLLEQRLFYAA